DGGLTQTITTGLDAGSVFADFRTSTGALYVRVYDTPGNVGTMSAGLFDVGAHRFVYLAPLSAPALESTVGPNGTEYVSSGDGIVRAIAPDGSTSWSFDTTTIASSFASAALALGTRVYMTTYNGFLAFE